MNQSQKMKLLQAALTHHQGAYQRHQANLEVYLENPVGVGEHQDLVEEVVTLTQKIAEANENVLMVQKLIEELA